MSLLKIDQPQSQLEIDSPKSKLEKAHVITARDTEATYFDKNGILRTAAPHEIRYSKNFDTGKQELLLEEASTNFLPNNRTGIGWTLPYYYTQIERYRGIDGVNNSATKLIGEPDGTTSQRLEKTIDIDEQIDNYIASVFIEKSSARCVFRIDIGDNIYRANFYADQGVSYDDDLGIEKINNYFRIWLSIPNESNNELIFRIYCENATTIFDGAQVEKGDEPTSPIITQDQPVTRPADKLVFATASFYTMS